MIKESKSVDPCLNSTFSNVILGVSEKSGASKQPINRKKKPNDRIYVVTGFKIVMLFVNLLIFINSHQKLCK